MGLRMGLRRMQAAKPFVKPCKVSANSARQTDIHPLAAFRWQEEILIRSSMALGTRLMALVGPTRTLADRLDCIVAWY
jgi:hypothetical protein